MPGSPPSIPPQYALPSPSSPSGFWCNPTGTQASRDRHGPDDLGHRIKFAQSGTSSRSSACHHLTLSPTALCWPLARHGGAAAPDSHPLTRNGSLGRTPRLHHLCKCALSGCEATLLARLLAGTSMQSWISRRQALRRTCEPTTVAVRKLPHQQQQQTRKDRLSRSTMSSGCCCESSGHVSGCVACFRWQPATLAPGTTRLPTNSPLPRV
jgi:hypothetical protein